DRYELLAYLEAIIRRANGHASALIKAGNLMMDLSRNLISIDGKFVLLSQKEYQIVNLLCMRKGTVLSKESFISHIYGCIDEPDSKIINVFVCKLRRKLEKRGLKHARIDTVWGQGHVSRDEDEKNEAEAIAV
ncbi:MAG: response regulator transcription factor, partial [Pseudomonadota bacterium]|nr:response regulator transcription factor [Pseudomonadota bacterium]